MKKIMIFLAGLLCLATLAFLGCKKENSSPGLTSDAKPVATGDCSNYKVDLVKTSDAFTTTFTWSITNLKPGNGTNGTTQNLSHWTFIPGCPGPDGLEQNWDDILTAAYSTDGSTFIPIIPTPELVPDPSQSCTSANLFKFNQGTSGSTPTYYRLVVAGKYSDGDVTAYFKSGAATGCCSLTVKGIGCKVVDECSLSQGYYFAKPGPTWLSDVTVGGYTYTEAEGRAIWNCSNKGGISDSKKGFTQVAALKLSGAYPTSDAAINADVVTVETWLAHWENW
jgi:hypothetical protein